MRADRQSRGEKRKAVCFCIVGGAGKTQSKAPVTAPPALRFTFKSLCRLKKRIRHISVIDDLHVTAKLCMLAELIKLRKPVLVFFFIRYVRIAIENRNVKSRRQIFQHI